MLAAARGVGALAAAPGGSLLVPPMQPPSATAPASPQPSAPTPAASAATVVHAPRPVTPPAATAAPAPTPVPPTPVAVAPAPTIDWTALGAQQPLLVQQNADGGALTVDRIDAAQLASCLPGGIQLSLDGGATWQTIATGGVQPAVMSSSLPLVPVPPGQGGPLCSTVVVDPAHPQSLYATFAVVQPSDATATVAVAYETADGGKTWTLVPPPQGTSPQGFAGFQLDGSAVQAFFVSAPGDDPDYPGAPVLSVEETADGGLTWSPASLTCPAVGPCVRWGPAPNGLGSCAAQAYDQPLEVSADGGQTWSTPTPPGGANVCGFAELVSFSGTAVALLSGDPQAPLWFSQDGGQTWAVAAPPPLPPDAAAPAYAGLQMLPDGTLLAQSGQTWYLLPAGASAWCSADAALPAQPRLLQPSGGRLWWVQSDGAPQSTAIGSLACQG
jgi:hypothetical protein